jgi:uncharacterized protein (TIRG00374 family)
MNRSPAEAASLERGSARPSSRWVKAALGFAIGALSLYLALRDLDLARAQAALGGIDLGWVAAGLGSVALNTWAKTARWQVLLGPAGRGIRMRNLLSSLLIGQTLNFLLPLRAGDLARAVTIGGRGAGRSYTLGTVVVEKVIDLFSYALLFAAVLALIPMPDWFRRSAWASIAIGLGAGSAITVLALRPQAFLTVADRLLNRLPERWGALIRGRLHHALSSLGSLRRRSDQLRLALWTSVVWTTAVATNHLVMLAFGVELPLPASIALALALVVAIALPAMPGRIGIHEYTCVVVLGLFGIDQTLAFSYGVVLHIVIMLPIILAGGVYYLAERRAEG